MYRDSIVSNNLGAHGRTRSAPYVALDVRALRRFSFSIGLRDEIYGSFNHELSPSIAAGFWLAPAFKLRGSVSRAFRLPTYTDLYYHDPANVGSPNSSSRARVELRRRPRLECGRSTARQCHRLSTPRARRDRLRSIYPDRHLASDKFPAPCVHRCRSRGCFATRGVAGNQLAVHRPPRRAERIERSAVEVRVQLSRTVRYLLLAGRVRPRAGCPDPCRSAAAVPARSRMDCGISTERGTAAGSVLFCNSAM